MTDQSDVFNNNQPQGNPQQTAPASTNPFSDHLASITNEDGTQKYGTVEDALKGAKHAQEHIPQLKSQNSTLEAENIALKAQVAQQGTLEDVVSRLTAQSNQPDAGSPPALPAGMTEESVVQLINNIKVNDQAVSNEKSVQEILVEKFGSKANEMVQAKAQEMGTTVQHLQEIARTSPTMALSLFQAAPTQTTQSVSSSVVMPAASDPTPVRPKVLDLLSGSSGVSDTFKASKAETYRKLGVE